MPAIDNIREYVQRVAGTLHNTTFENLEAVAGILLTARENGKWMFLAGNGGSASTASHFANDLVKGLSIADKPRCKAMALCDSTPVMTALANDYEYSRVYEEQLKNYASAGDVLMLFSGSGNSPNVVHAAQFGKDAALTVVSFAGRDGGRIKPLSDIYCVAVTGCMEEIEDIHLVWCHALITALRQAILTK